jgi:hypothetical protein
MYFESGGIYHIYNQGNKRQPEVLVGARLGVALRLKIRALVLLLLTLRLKIRALVLLLLTLRLVTEV